MTESCKMPECVVCGGATRLCLDLGQQPLANALLSSQYEAYDTYTLGIAECPMCSHGQLTHFVPPAQLFKNYLYASGTGGALQPYFEWFAKQLSRCLPPNARVLEIACNDGSLLDCFRDVGLNSSGVDPAGNLTEVACKKGHDVLTGFFPQTRHAGNFDAIVAMNVCAHTPEPRALMQGIAEMLAPSGTAFIQTSQAFMLQNAEFDTIYHEHYSYFTPASMTRLANDCGLRIEACKLVSVHGRSFMWLLRHTNAAPMAAAFNSGPPFDVAWPAPEPEYMSTPLSPEAAAASYRGFSERAERTITAARTVIDAEQQSGAPVALVGVAAKALTFIQAAGIRPDFYIDGAVLKIGRFVPGAQRAISTIESASELSDDTLFMIGAWNFADTLSEKIRAQRPGKRTRFLVCFPELRHFN